MLRLLVPLLLLAASFALPSASAEGPGPCDRLGCPAPVVVVDGERACAGVDADRGGVAYCWHADRPFCVTRYVWGGFQEVCPLEYVGDPVGMEDRCDTIMSCPRPIVVVEGDRACVGVGFQYGGYAACWDAARPNCVTQHFGYAYTETCVPPEDFWPALSTD